MGKKYIIEKDDNESIWSIYADANGDATIEGVSLTPYTEPDLGLLVKENFERGYRQRKAEDEKDLEQVRKEAYDEGYADAKGGYENGFENGMIVAWEAARKIQDTGGNLNWWIHNTSASDAIEKIRQYEQEKDRQARIEYNFDEIKDVLETTVKECNVSLDEIAEVLRKMKETDNG